MMHERTRTDWNLRRIFSPLAGNVALGNARRGGSTNAQS